MGKHLGRKHSYVRVEDDHHGCIWTLFRMINHHPWHNVKKMLPYKKYKPHEKSCKSKPEGEHEISKTLELGEDSILTYSASVNSRSSRNSSGSKKSIKARIKGLMKEKDSSTKSDKLIQEAKNLQGNEEEGDYDSSAPTLMSLLKANPKLIRSVCRVDESRGGERVKHKDSNKEDDYVGVLELFHVDQDLFLRILDDGTPRNPRLVKSGTFPSRNPSLKKPPSKIEHKHNEVWPTMITNERELKKAKSQGVARSSSLTESLDRHGYLFDSSSNKAIKKHLSKSLRLTNEKEFGLLDGSLRGRRSFSMSESSYDKSGGELKELRVDSPTYFESSTKLIQLDEQESRNIEEQVDDSTTMTSICDTNDGLTLVSTPEACPPEDEIEVVEWPILEESILELSNTRDSNDQYLMEYYNEDLQYMKFVLDIAGIAMGGNQGEEWHAENQPLDPALFDGIEVCCPFEPKTTNKDDVIVCNNMSRSHRKVLFDLINEALVDVHERCYANYYPKALSYWCHLCPKMKGKSREVEEFVRECLSWRPELDPALDVAMARDLSKDKNGWVNLQMDTEGVGLELEDLIFDELLDEFASY